VLIECGFKVVDKLLHTMLQKLSAKLSRGGHGISENGRPRRPPRSPCLTSTHVRREVTKRPLKMVESANSKNNNEISISFNEIRFNPKVMDGNRP